MPQPVKKLPPGLAPPPKKSGAPAATHGHPLVSITLAVLRKGEGVAKLRIQDTEARPIRLHPGTGTFENAVTHVPLPLGKATFTLAPGGVLADHLDPGTLEVEAHISGLTGVGMARAALYNDGEQVGEIQTADADAPLNVEVETDPTGDKRIGIQQCKAGSFPLKNKDSEDYQLDWLLMLGGTKIENGTVLLPAKSSSRIEATAPKTYFNWTELVRPAPENAILKLRLHDPQTPPYDSLTTSQKAGFKTNDYLPAQSVEVPVSMYKASRWWTSLLRAAYVTLLLLAGGFVSILGNAVLPNILRKARLRQRMNELADRTSSISIRIDSYLRVLLRLERKKISSLLDHANFFDLSINESLDEASDSLDRLQTRVEVAERLDELRRTWDANTSLAPPSCTDEIDRQLQSAANQLHAFALPDENVKAARAFLDEAEKQLKLIDDSDALAKQVAGEFAKLQLRIASFADHKDYYSDLAAALPGVFGLLDPKFSDPQNITRRMIFALDHGIAAMQMSLDYAMVRASFPPSPLSASGGESARQRLLKRQPRLIELLGTLSWRALQEARSLVQQMRENVYEENLIEAVGQKGESEIFYDTQKPRPYLPLYFTIRFKKPEYNNAAAISQLTTNWEFSDGLTEDGWKVCHYFEPANRTYGQMVKSWFPGMPAGVEKTLWERVKSWVPRFDRQTGETIAKIQVDVHRQRDPAQKGCLEDTISVQARSRPIGVSRFWAETVRFGIAFAAALAGLFSGALQQLEKLDFLAATVAIIALGFGADSIKNILGKGPAKNGS